MGSGRVSCRLTHQTSSGQQRFQREQLRGRILAQLLLPRGPALWNAEPLKYAVRRSTHVCGHRSARAHTHLGTCHRTGSVETVAVP